jgi:hypothetical protein
MDLQPAFRKTAFAFVSTLCWVAACSSDQSNNPSGDAAADGSEDASADVTSEMTPQDTGARRDARPLPVPDAGSVCTALAVTCDGPEDCPGGHCCGTLGMVGGGLGYTQVACAPTCSPAADAGAAPDAAAAPDGGLVALGGALLRELCHAGTTCETPMATCGVSLYLPSFLYRCDTTMATPPPASNAGGPGVNCGTATCVIGQECCVVPPFGPDAGPGAAYCAPAGTACSCAGPGDAGPPADAAPEAAAETGADAQPDAGGPDGAPPEAGDAAGDVSSGPDATE